MKTPVKHPDSDGVSLHCRMDATLKELTSLVKEVNPDARRKGTFFDFAQVYPEVSGRGMGGMGGITHRMREIGSTCSGQKGADDSKTLSQVRSVAAVQLLVSRVFVSCSRGNILRGSNILG